MSFTRDRFTWMAYLLVGLLTFFQGALGPVVTFVRAELKLNYSEAAFHFSAVALGSIVAGLAGPGLAHRFGRKRMLWSGIGGLAIQAGLITFGQTLAMTVLGAFIGGIGSSLLQMNVQASLSDHHGPRRAYAITEMNVAASIAATLAPFLVGALARTDFTWRGALQLMWLYAGLMFVLFWRTPVTNAPPAEAIESRAGRLSGAFYLMVAILALTTAIEWSVIFWGADFLENVVGLFKADAASMMSAFFFAMLIGRIVGSRLTRQMQSQTLLLIAVVISIIGFALLWLSPFRPLNLIGLFVCGLGVANYFPQSLSIALGLAAGQTNRANGMITVSLSTAILIAPQVLGGVADSVGIWGALGLVSGMMIGALGLTYLAFRVANRPPTPAQASA